MTGDLFNARRFNRHYKIMPLPSAIFLPWNQTHCKANFHLRSSSEIRCKRGGKPVIKCLVDHLQSKLLLQCIKNATARLVKSLIAAFQIAPYLQIVTHYANWSPLMHTIVCVALTQFVACLVEGILYRRVIRRRKMTFAGDSDTDFNDVSW